MLCLALMLQSLYMNPTWILLRCCQCTGLVNLLSPHFSAARLHLLALWNLIVLRCHNHDLRARTAGKISINSVRRDARQEIMSIVDSVEHSEKISRAS